MDLRLLFIFDPRILNVMDWTGSLSHLRDWLHRLGTNRYFWTGLAVLGVVAAVVYVTFNSFVMPAYTRHDVSITVPNVEEMPVEEARDVLQQKGLQVEQQQGRYNPNVPRDLVVDQSPPHSSAVKPGRRVYLTINTGEVPTVQIPDFTGTSLREARNRISSIGLEVGAVQEDSVPSPYPQTVTRQRPEAGDSLKQGKTVDLWYSTGLGNTTAQVPVLVGLQVNQAEKLLLQQRLRSVVVTASAGDAETDSASVDSLRAQLFVREQSRAPGTSVRTGTEIRLFTTSDSTAARKQRQAVPDSTFLRRPGPRTGPQPDTSAGSGANTQVPDSAATDTSSSRLGF